MTNDRRPVALVTGSTTGIGFSLMQRLAQAGYRVALHSRTGSATIQGAVRALDGAPHFPADLLNDCERYELIDTVIDHFGSLDVLVNNAGESSRIPLKTCWLTIWIPGTGSTSFIWLRLGGS